MSKLFSVHESVNYYLYRRPVKMSKSFDSLAALIRTELNRDIINGDVFLFLNRNRTMIKVLVYEKKGFSIFYRRLDEGVPPRSQKVRCLKKFTFRVYQKSKQMEQKQANGASREQKMFALIAEHEASTMTVKDFCELYDLSQGMYYYWQKKYHSQLANKPVVNQSSFTLLKVTEPQEDSNAQVVFAEYRGIRFYQEPSVSFLKALIS